MGWYFPKPFRSFGENINVKVDLSNYATKTDLKTVTHLDTSTFTLKTNLANLKTEVNKLDIGKLVTVPCDLSKFSNEVKNQVVKTIVYDKLVPKVNNINTNEFVLITKYDANKTELEKKIPDTNKLVKKSDYNAKVSEIESKIPSISGLVTTSVLTAVEKKITSVSNLVKQKQIITQKLVNLKGNLLILNTKNLLPAQNFAARLTQEKLIKKNYLVLIERLVQIKQNIYFLKMNWKN